MKLWLLLFSIFAYTISLAQANRNDVVIDEIMADPNPPAQPGTGLPEVEFIELKNVSQKSFALNGWKFSDATTTATINSNFILQPDSFVIICSMSAISLLAMYGHCIGVSNFPSLDNDGELLSLVSKEGRVIHAVEYNNTWYQNDVKMNGGWSLEMIDTKNACSGASNWISSTYITGGTPGKENSVNATNGDQMPPALLRAFAIDSLHISLIFDEPLDSLSATNAANYSISDDIGTAFSVVIVPPLFNKTTLVLRHPLKTNNVYLVATKKLSDCSGNEIGILNSAKVGVASTANNFDVVINEILFNPKPDAVDYVEIYNRSDKIIDLKELHLANRSLNGAIGSLKQLSITPYIFFPKEHLVITENKEVTKQRYYSRNKDAFIQLNAMPSYPDDRGTVVLLNATGSVIDEVSYSEKWHFKLIDNNEGVALERIDYNKASQDPGNWHSASTSAGYGTPTYQNSQFMAEHVVDRIITIKPEVFSPDNDGFNDFATISYQFPEPGYSCNITFFDANGMVIRYLARNALCGLTGYFRWDGLDEKYNKLPVGVYVMITEVFNLKGTVKKFKTPIILARRLK